jgi:rare lipoprotein A
MMQKTRALQSAVLISLLIAFIACHHHHETEAPEQPKQPKQEPEAQIFVGLASYYGVEMTNQVTASGERFDPNGLTAAHRTLPFGTKVMVTNLENNRSVIVTITDRGPERKDRLIDLSFAAARELDMLTVGVVKVRVEVVHE